MEKSKFLGDIDYFIRTNSFIGLQALYACSLAYTSKKPFRIADLSADLKFFMPDYVQGFITACSCAQIIDTVVNRDMINVVYVDSDLNKKIKAEIYKLGKKFDDADNKNRKTGETNSNFWVDEIIKLEKHFSDID